MGRREHVDEEKGKTEAYRAISKVNGRGRGRICEKKKNLKK